MTPEMVDGCSRHCCSARKANTSSFDGVSVVLGLRKEVVVLME